MFLSGMFGFKSNSNESEAEDVDDQADDLFSNIVDDITKTFRRTLSWCKFKVGQFQRHAQSQTRLNERREMYERKYNIARNENIIINERRKVYERRHSIACDESILTSNGLTKSLSGNVLLKDTAEYTSRLNETRISISDRVKPKSKALSRQFSADDVWKIATNDLSKSDITKSRSDSAISTHLIPRVTKNEVEDRVSKELAARRKEMCGMTSFQRVAFFRDKYGLCENKN